MKQRKHILIVDDHEDTCIVLSKLLNNAGYEVATARTIASAVSLARSYRYDIYILDNWFPDGSGIELCKQIRASDSCTPIVFYSGVSGQLERDNAAIAGAQAYLIKPVDIDQLTGTISNLISCSLAA
ncbi:MAG TPA: response regulator [Blastocatellia bacterium]|nr:response regulator [Blastocatellia bacterium]